MNARYPQADSPESIEGTAAHWVATEMFAGRVHPEGSPAPGSVIVTGEMLDGAELVCETIARRIPDNLALHVEERVDIKTVHETCFGTPDYWAIDRIQRHLEIIDYKFGHGFVDEIFNPQGLLYMLGIFESVREKLFAPGADQSDWTVAFTIVQPRCYYRGEPVRTHAYNLREAYSHLEKLRAAAAAAMLEKPVATTNDECEYCPGRHACSALQMSAYKAAEISNRRAPVDLTPQAAGLELRMLERALDRLQARVDGLKELTIANIRAGRSVPHYNLEPGRGRQQWTAPVEHIITTGQLLGKDLSKPGVVTPAQAKKMGIDDSVISAYSAITPGSLKLVPENNANAQRVFGKG